MPEIRAHRRAAAIVLLAVAAAGTALAASLPAQRARHAMVSGPEPIAVEAALDVLRDGGNAVDAAVTMGLTLAVTYPQAGNIGGGGYMLIRKATGEAMVIDYRETAPSAATRDMFLDPNGDVLPDASLRTYRATGVPGTVAGLAMALDKHGTISWSRAITPAVRLARRGFAVSRGLESNFDRFGRSLAAWPASRSIFMKGDSLPREGDRLVQRDLASTLEILRRDGPRAFYEGIIARTIASDMKSHGGLITENDLASYRAVARPALKGSYRSFEILTVPPSSAGGVALIQSLNMIEPFNLASLGRNSSACVHLVAEALKRVFADRSRWIGDPDFVTVPVAGLLSRDYAASRMRDFDPLRATPAERAGPGAPPDDGESSTTHYSIVDAAGNAVSNSYTLNERFGSGAVPEGLGFLLNNEMDDFSAKPDQPNLYGLTGGEANSIAPGRRMVSSMTPAMVVAPAGDGPGRIRLVLGSPGGAPIISSVLQVVIDVVDFGMELQAAVDAPRFHHQWLPDRLFVDEGGFPADVLEALRRRGHEVVERAPRNEVIAVLVDGETGWIRGAADARGYGAARGY